MCPQIFADDDETGQRQQFADKNTRQKTQQINTNILEDKVLAYCRQGNNPEWYCLGIQGSYQQTLSEE